MKLEYYSDVTGGKLQPRISKKIAADLAAIFEGKRVVVTIQKKTRSRTLPQNSLWHLYVGILANEFGYDPEEMKEILKYRFLKRQKADEETGEIFEYVAPTSSLTVDEFTELVERTLRFGAENGVILPVPEDYGIGQN